ncbi:LptF/LptG family permease [bacterium]|nr:LptF/LptG family permease [bacterium]
MGFSISTFVLLLDKFVDLANLILSKGVNIFLVLRLFLYLIPSLLYLTIPMGFLMGSLLTFGKLSADNEIIAMRSSGLSLYHIISPILLLSLTVSLLLVFYNNNYAPRLQFSFKKLYYEIIYKAPLLKFDEHTFTNVQNYQIYIEKINKKKNELKGIVIYRKEKKSDLPTLIIAQSGSLLNPQKEVFTLKLKDGSIQKKDSKNPDKYGQLFFQNYEIPLNFSKTKDFSLNKSVLEMDSRELKEKIKTLKKDNAPTSSLEVWYYIRWAIAFTSFAFTLIGIPLGIKAHRGKKSFGFGLSLILFFIYYLLLSISLTLGERGFIDPRLDVWIPNIITGTAGFILLYKTEKG